MFFKCSKCFFAVIPLKIQLYEKRMQQREYVGQYYLQQDISPREEELEKTGLSNVNNK